MTPNNHQPSLAHRTDLALERIDFKAADSIPGVRQEKRQMGALEVHIIDIETNEAGQQIGKAVGRYITVESGGFSSPSPSFAEDVDAIAGLLRELLPLEAKSVLVVGLGNADITPDALGPLVVAHTLATRHINEELAASIGLSELTPVSALAPGVLGQTGIETAEVIGAVCKEVHPDLVVVIDALAAKSVRRLGNTIQMANTGISPGSGVMNRRRELSAETLGVPVISMGVPTVVDLASIVTDACKDSQHWNPDEFQNMMVTPREIDVLMEHAAKTIAYAIGKCFQPNLTLQELVALTA